MLVMVQNISLSRGIQRTVLYPSFIIQGRGFPKHYDFEEGNFDVYFDLFCKGEVDFGSYFKMLRSWFDRRNDDNVLFVRYEDIRADKRGVVMEIAKFIGEGMESRLLQDNGTLMDKVFQYSSLEEMKKEPLIV